MNKICISVLLRSQVISPVRRLVATQKFVPKHEPVKSEDVAKLEKFLNDKPNILVLTGAGISTESGMLLSYSECVALTMYHLGIPDYRSEGVGLYERSNHKPIQHPEFVKSSATRKRYWARNFVGWPKFSSVKPCHTHYKLAKMERELRLNHIVTQNVDNLHGKSGSKKVIELHGNGFKVICLGCGYSIPRHDFQLILNQLNPHLRDTSILTMRPDGDVELSDEDVEKFFVPDFSDCGGALKPHIVFFGDNVPRPRIESIIKILSESDGVLVLGSSLTVFSGYRIILQAKDLGLPVAAVNIGKTRADDKIDLKISAKCSEVLKHLFN